MIKCGCSSARACSSDVAVDVAVFQHKWHALCFVSVMPDQIVEICACFAGRCMPSIIAMLLIHVYNRSIKSDNDNKDISRISL